MKFDEYKQVMPVISRYMHSASCGMDKEQKQKLIQDYEIIHDILWGLVDKAEKDEIHAYWIGLFKFFGKNNFGEEHV